MKKYWKFIISVIAIICIITITVIYNKIYDKSQANSDLQENQNIENTVQEDEIKNEISNSIEIENNVISENVVAEEIIDVSREDATSAVYEQDNNIGSTDKKQEAINLVKQKWGEDGTVTFRCDSVTNDGEYIIAVVSKSSARVQNYFRVNLENQSVIVDY